MSFNPETKETVVATMGELQLHIWLERIKAEAGIEVTTDLPRIAYRETINAPAAAEFQHKKQTGGRGQYARVAIAIKPLPRGEQFRQCSLSGRYFRTVLDVFWCVSSCVLGSV